MSGQVLVRLPSGLAAVVRREAKAGNVTDASLIRNVLVQHLPDADPQDAQPQPRARQPYKAPPGIVHDLMRAREAAAEATGVLVRVAVRTREEGLHALHAEAERSIPIARRAALELQDLAGEITRHHRAFRHVAVVVGGADVESVPATS